MELVAFIRGANVGGYRRFRPAVVARALSRYDVVNVGAAGTFVVRKPKPRAEFLAALRRELPFSAEILLCDSGDILQLETERPFGAEASAADVTRFVSVLPKPARSSVDLPITFPGDGDWLVRVIQARGRFVFGTYRRHMKTIGYLGEIDKLFGARATTRNWNTVEAIVRILREPVTNGR